MPMPISHNVISIITYKQSVFCLLTFLQSIENKSLIISDQIRYELSTKNENHRLPNRPQKQIKGLKTADINTRTRAIQNYPSPNIGKDHTDNHLIKFELKLYRYSVNQLCFLR